MDTRAKRSYFAHADNCHLTGGKAVKDSCPHKSVSFISGPAAYRARIWSIEVCFLIKGYVKIHNLTMEKEEI